MVSNRLKLEITKAKVLPLAQENDRYLMDDFRQLQNLDAEDLYDINRVHIFLQEMTLSNIVDGPGLKIMADAFKTQQMTDRHLPCDGPDNQISQQSNRTYADGQHFCTCIIECIKKHEEGHHKTNDHIKFHCSVNEDEYEEIVMYNELKDFIQKEVEDNWAPRPLKPNDPQYMGTCFNVSIKWENGKITNEPLDTIAANDPITFAINAR